MTSSGACISAPHSGQLTFLIVVTSDFDQLLSAMVAIALHDPLINIPSL
jgi:hypothetical protein